jgi:hypothetical protein
MLADLDELVLRCRDERARAYIREAVTCCKAGAYRSAIVSAWIAVAFDIIDKIHELSLAGDKSATGLVEEFEVIISKHDLTRALSFERRLLNIAKDDFELISAQEHTDLERLQQDRHRCAHPSHQNFGQVFSPPAELARLHVRLAVEHLLQHEPAQGKAALDRLFKEILSEYFPTKDSDALAYLSKGPLKRARRSLIRNLMLVLLKTSVDPEQDQLRWKCRRALNCVRQMHPVVWDEVLRADLTKIFRGLSDPGELVLGAELLGLDASLVEALDTDQIIRVKQFIRELRASDLELLDTALDIHQFAEASRYRIARLTAAEIREHAFVFFMMPTPIREHIIASYSSVTSFDEANQWGRAIQESAGEFLADEARSILTAAAANPQIRGSFQLAKVIAALKKHSGIPEPEFTQLARAATGKDEANAEIADPGSYDESIPF